MKKELKDLGKHIIKKCKNKNTFLSVILGVINFNPLPGSIIIDFATNLGFAVIDRMLGGQGETLKKGRDFSLPFS